MGNNKLVSIIVPTLNGAFLLKDLFTSVYNQDYKEIEIIVNDDIKTTDNTQDLIKEWSNKLKIIYIQKNSRLGEGRLEGAKMAKGKYIFSVDADFRIRPSVISDSINILENDADAVYIPEEAIGEGFWTKCKWLEKRCYWGDETTSTPRFYRTSTYFEIGGHNPNLALSEDKDLDLKFKKFNKIIKWTKEYIYHNERRINIVKTFKNKFFWSQTGFEFLEENPTAAWKQVLFIYFRKAYFKNWKLLLSHPLLTMGMYTMKTAELSGAICGGIGTKLGIIKSIKYKTQEEK